MFDLLACANALQRPTAPPRSDAYAEDLYYRSHAPRRRRLSVLVPLAGIVALVVLALDALPR
jgi:hypothetical protein